MHKYSTHELKIILPCAYDDTHRLGWAEREDCFCHITLLLWM